MAKSRETRVVRNSASEAGPAGEDELLVADPVAAEPVTSEPAEAPGVGEEKPPEKKAVRYTDRVSVGMGETELRARALKLRTKVAATVGGEPRDVEVDWSTGHAAAGDQDREAVVCLSLSKRVAGSKSYRKAIDLALANGFKTREPDMPAPGKAGAVVVLYVLEVDDGASK